MSVYKEAVHAIKLIQSRSKRVYSDACDFGVPVRKGDEIWNWAKQLVDWYGEEGTREVTKYSTGTTVSHLVSYMPHEHQSARFERVKVVYVTTRHEQNMDGYIYVEKA
jgi:hypothetical protein